MTSLRDNLNEALDMIEKLRKNQRTEEDFQIQQLLSDNHTNLLGLRMLFPIGRQNESTIKKIKEIINDADILIGKDSNNVYDLQGYKSIIEQVLEKLKSATN